MYIISKCLLGCNCKYNGGNNLNEAVVEFSKSHTCISICPESLGGLSSPRCPAEIVEDECGLRVVDKDGKITGFDVDLIQAIGKQMGMEVNIQNMSFDGLVPALKTGNLDVAISGMTITEERKKSISFFV